MATKIFQSYAEFLQREDKDTNGVSASFSEDHPEYEKENDTNKGCWNCSRCSDCSDCSGQSYTNGIKSVYADSERIMGNYPVIENIHQRVLSAASGEGALNMKDWHTCETTHCLAGWVVNLAGEAGKRLEAHTTTQFAAMMIYKASSPIRVYPPRFFESNEAAMADMKRCAEEEAALIKYR